MDVDGITELLLRGLPQVPVVVASKESGAPEVAWGDRFFFYGADRMSPLATIVTKDYPGFDTASNLDRDGVFRLNVGLGRDTYDRILPVRNTSHDLSALDVLMPHPIYGRNHWVCVLNPSDETLERLRPLLEEAYRRVVQRDHLNSGPAAKSS